MLQQDVELCGQVTVLWGTAAVRCGWPKEAHRADRISDHDFERPRQIPLDDMPTELRDPVRRLPPW